MDLQYHHFPFGTGPFWTNRGPFRPDYRWAFWTPGAQIMGGPFGTLHCQFWNWLLSDQSTTPSSTLCLGCCSQQLPKSNSHHHLLRFLARVCFCTPLQNVLSFCISDMSRCLRDIIVACVASTCRIGNNGFSVGCVSLALGFFFLPRIAARFCCTSPYPSPLPRFYSCCRRLHQVTELMKRAHEGRQPLQYDNLKSL